MGVQGLTSYVENKRHFLHSIKVKNTNLVIDGCSLFYRLCFTSGLDLEHGGDYDAFALLTRQFFEALFACNIRPFVVLDGGIDHTDKKFKTMKERLQSKIKEASTLSRGGNGYILPLLTNVVFVQVLSSLHVPFVQCISEADWEIASLANQWNCAVLTNDSDFYIFDLRGGYLPLAYFNWDSVGSCKKTSENHISASCFFVNKFCSHFNHMNKALLPLFAVIIGNDYSSLRGADRLFSQIPLPEADRGGRAHSRIDGLLHWLARFANLEQAMDEVLELLGGNERAVRAQLSSGMKNYQLSGSQLALYFAGGSPKFGLPDPLDAIPQWLFQALLEARLPSMVIDVLVHERAILYVQVENCSQPSSHTTSQAIRQVIYSLLLDWKQRRGEMQDSWGRGQTQDSWRRGQTQAVWGRGQKQAAWGRGQMPESWGRGRGQTRGPSLNGALYSVEEFDRQSLELKSSFIPAAQSHLLKQLLLEKIHEISMPLRRQLLLKTLGTDNAVTSAVPCSLSLVVCVTCYWLKSSKPKPRLPHLQALLLGLVFGELCRLRASQRGRAAYLAQCEVCERLGRLRVSRATRARLDLDAAHIYSQWQSCMWTSFHLNRLLGSPLPDPDCACIYSGTLVHRVLRELEGGTTPEALLAGWAPPGDLYRNLLEAVWSSVGAAFFTSSSSRKKKKRGQRRGAEAGAAAAVPWTDVSNRFGMLVVQDQYEES